MRSAGSAVAVSRVLRLGAFALNWVANIALVALLAFESARLGRYLRLPAIAFRATASRRTSPSVSPRTSREVAAAILNRVVDSEDGQARRPAGSAVAASRGLRLGGFALNWVANIALVALLAFVMAMLAAPHVVGWRYGILRSGSMSPAMPTGAAIIVAPAGNGDVLPGDVITFRSASNHDLLVTHRVVSISQDGNGRTAFVTKGDANKSPDEGAVTVDRLVGKVIFDIPEIGRLVRRLHTRAAFLFLIAFPTALIIALELRELAGGVKDLRQGKKARTRNSVGKTIAKEA